MPVPAAKKNYIKDNVLREKSHTSGSTAGGARRGKAPVGQGSNYEHPPRDGKFNGTFQGDLPSRDAI